MEPASRSFWQKLGSMLRHRCPRCGEGRIFSGLLRMNDPCPACGLIFQREEGYFLGSMYFSYPFGAIMLGIGYIIGILLFPKANPYLILAALFVPFVLLTPTIFRYSRTLWIYYDRWGCPSEVSAGPYEKVRGQMSGVSPSSVVSGPLPKTRPENGQS